MKYIKYFLSGILGISSSLVIANSGHIESITFQDDNSIIFQLHNSSVKACAKQKSWQVFPNQSFYPTIIGAGIAGYEIDIIPDGLCYGESAGIADVTVHNRVDETSSFSWQRNNNKSNFYETFDFFESLASQREYTDISESAFACLKVELENELKKIPLIRDIKIPSGNEGYITFKIGFLKGEAYFNYTNPDLLVRLIKVPVVSDDDVWKIVEKSVDNCRDFL